jgi:hypothetical protein
MTRETYLRLLARKIGYEHLIEMDTREAEILLKSQGKEVTIAEWNQREEYMDDGIYVENQVNLVSRNSKVWSVCLAYDNSVI